MKKFWVKISPFNKNLVTAALEAGAHAVMVPKGYASEVHKLAKTMVISEDGDLKLGRDVQEVTIHSKADEAKVVAAKGKIPTIIANIDWTIIPLENLISKTTNLIQTVESAGQAKVALETMEKGADGILLIAKTMSQIKETAKVFEQAQNVRVHLVPAKIKSIKPVAISDRCCIDTCSVIAPGAGMLVGNSSSAMFLVYSENVKSPYCDPRPFRVNAGAVHAYVMTPGNKTKYLMELGSGDEVLIVDYKGGTSVAAVGRNKMERRPMLLVTAEHEGKEVALILQNAETIRLTSPKGKPVSVTSLKRGDLVMAHFMEGGRHFGSYVKETITEK
jgi:3-dehydroquinate synthase II